MVKVLFVCLGNICRSPIAEEVFRNLVSEKGLSNHISCDSAGTGAYHIGSLPDKRMRKVASDNGILLTHQARQLSCEDYSEFDYIMAMDVSNFDHIQRQVSKANGLNTFDHQLYLYRMFDPQREDSSIVPDPYYDDHSAFVEVYDIVTRSGSSFLDFLIKKHSFSVGSNSL